MVNIARMQQKRGTAAEWSALNPVLLDGEIGFEKDTGLFKIGDGVTPWSGLVQALPSEIVSQTDLAAELDTFESQILATNNATFASRIDPAGVDFAGPLSVLGVPVGSGGGGGTTVSLTEKGTWATSTAYVVGDVVTQSGIRYIAKTAHTAGTFLTDLGAGRWTATSLSNAVVTLGAKRDFGATGNARVVTDAVVTASSTTLTSATAVFTAGDVGRTVAIPYAGAGATVGETHVTTIVSVESATSCTLASAPVKSIAGARTVTDAALNATALTLTSATGAFTVGDVGKKVTVPNGYYTVANSGGAPYEVLITGFTSSTVVTISHRPLTTVSAQTVTIPGAWVIIGTDDTAALQAAVTGAASQRKVLELEPGRYLTTAALVPASNTSIYGHGAGISIVNPVGATLFGAFQYLGSGTASIITDVTLRDFEIDGRGNRASAYTSAGKAIYLRPVRRLRVESMYLHDTASTSLGCDWVPDSVYANNVIDWGGSLAWIFGGGAGGSGIGLGTGLFPQEPVTIIGNTVSNCGNNGIFTESQSGNVRSSGVRIIGNHVIGCGFYGISDRGCEGTVIADNTIVFVAEGGIYIAQGFVAGLYSIDTLVQGNVVKDTRGTGIDVVTREGDVFILNNIITGRGSSGTSGIRVAPVTGGTLIHAVIRGNSVRDYVGRGIWVTAGAWNRVTIADNILRDLGATTKRAGIVWAGTSVGSLYVRANVVFDSRTSGSKNTSYGFEAASGTIARLVWGANDFADLNDGETLMTITPTTTVGTVGG